MVLIAGVIFFVIKISTIKISQKNHKFIVNGQLFFASTNTFIDYFKKVDIQERNIQIDFSNSHIWDDSAVRALFKVKELLQEREIEVELIGLNTSSQKLISQLDSISSSH